MLNRLLLPVLTLPVLGGTKPEDQTPVLWLALMHTAGALPQPCQHSISFYFSMTILNAAANACSTPLCSWGHPHVHAVVPTPPIGKSLQTTWRLVTTPRFSPSDPMSLSDSGVNSVRSFWGSC